MPWLNRRLMTQREGAGVERAAADCRGGSRTTVRSTMTFGKILIWHLLIGVPLAAFTHSVVQFAYEPPASFTDILVFPLHFLLGVGCGLPVLIPAYTLQAGLF